MVTGGVLSLLVLVLLLGASLVVFRRRTRWQPWRRRVGPAAVVLLVDAALLVGWLLVVPVGNGHYAGVVESFVALVAAGVTAVALLVAFAMA